MTEDQQILSESANRLLADKVEAAGLDPDEAALGAALMAAFETQGFLGVLVSEADGGVGGGWADAGVLLHALGFHGAPGPMADEIVARGLASLTGAAPRFAMAEGLATMGGAPAHAAYAPDDPCADASGLALAAARAMQMAGGVERVLELTVGYAKDRVQFGRALAAFQAIQQQLAVLAGEAAAARRAADHAFLTLDRAPTEVCAAAPEIAAAKIRCGEAAGKAASIAHQVHGAIGFTHEHTLHRYTRALWSWRAEGGTEAVWSKALGAAMMAGGADAHWAAITSR